MGRPGMSIALALSSVRRVKLLEICDLERDMSNPLRSAQISGRNPGQLPSCVPEACVPEACAPEVCAP